MIVRLRADGHQRAHHDALMAGLRALGVSDLGDDVAVTWGWRTGKQWRAAGYRVLVLERGYIGDRLGKYSSLAWNGLNGRGTFPEYPDDGGERFRACGFNLGAKRNGGEYTLIIGQVATDAAVSGVNIREWYAQAIEIAEAEYGLPVLFRPHPDDVSRGLARHNATLADDLSGAAHVVTYSSNAAVDALLAGIDTVAVDAGSMAYGVAGTAIGAAANFDAREEWAYRLAWKQWTLDEIASGEALRGLV